MRTPDEQRPAVLRHARLRVVDTKSGTVTPAASSMRLCTVVFPRGRVDVTDRDRSEHESGTFADSAIRPPSRRDKVLGA